MRISTSARISILDTLYTAKNGHYGGSFSLVEIIQALLTYTNIGPRSNTGDILILSKGHAAIAYYAVLNAMGLAKFDLSRYGESTSGLDIHPCIHSNPWVHFSTGSLGQGLSYGLGAALAGRDQNRHVWVVLGDGECQEGQVWEAAALASRYELSNLHAIIDLNGYQECGWNEQPQYRQAPLPDASLKWQAFGWQAQPLNGQSLIELKEWIASVQKEDQNNPYIAIASTTKGAGIPFFETHPQLSHCASLSKQNYLAARDSLIYDETF